MKNTMFLISGLLVLAATLTFFGTAQTLGGDTTLNSKTWTWTGLTEALPSATLFTPTTDSDFLVTMYLNATITDAVGGQICTVLQWTDDLGTNTYPFPASRGTACSGISGGTVFQAQSAIPIHVLANTPVSVSTLYSVPPGSPQPTYNFVVGKVKLNP